MDFKKRNTVFIYDITDQRMFEMVDYCETNELSLIRFENVDISDHSLMWDTLASFDFESEDDIIMFKLRFNTK